LPEERAWLGEQLTPRTLVDVVRSLHPDEDGPYSWWSWLGQSFAKDAGWRIDYHLATPRLARTAVRAHVDREHGGVRLSDHALAAERGRAAGPSRGLLRLVAACPRVPSRLRATMSVLVRAPPPEDLDARAVARRPGRARRTPSRGAPRPPDRQRGLTAAALQ